MQCCGTEIRRGRPNETADRGQDRKKKESGEKGNSVASIVQESGARRGGGEAPSLEEHAGVCKGTLDSVTLQFGQDRKIAEVSREGQTLPTQAFLDDVGIDAVAVQNVAGSNADRMGCPKRHSSLVGLQMAFELVDAIGGVLKDPSNVRTHKIAHRAILSAVDRQGVVVGDTTKAHKAAHDAEHSVDRAQRKLVRCLHVVEFLIADTILLSTISGETMRNQGIGGIEGRCI